jgi:PA14 domain
MPASFDGTNLDGPYLGTLLDTPFPVPSSNLGTGINHSFPSGEIAFGQFDTVSGVWRGTLDFPAGNYILRFYTVDGLRVRVNDSLILDEWRDQVAVFNKVVALAGPTRIQIEWYENVGGKGLSFRWQPTAQQPPATMVRDVPESVVVNAGTVASGNAASLAADDDTTSRSSPPRRARAPPRGSGGSPAFPMACRICASPTRARTARAARKAWRSGGGRPVRGSSSTAGTSGQARSPSGI